MSQTNAGKEHRIGVYKITNLATNDFYIGQSSDVKKRKYNHRTVGIHTAKFEEDIKKYGWEGFSFEIIEVCNKEELKEREAYYIQELHPTYNVIVRGRRLSQEMKAHLSRMNTGKKQTPETIEKRKKSIAERHKTIPQTNAGHRKRVYTDYGDGGMYASFASIQDAAIFFGVHPSTVSKAIKRNGKVKGVRVWLEV